MVPLSTCGSERSHSRRGYPIVRSLDCQRRCRDDSSLAGRSGTSAFDRSRPVDSLLVGHALGHQRNRVLCLAVYDQPVAKARTEVLGCVPKCIVDGTAIFNALATTYRCLVSL